MAEKQAKGETMTTTMVGRRAVVGALASLPFVRAARAAAEPLTYLFPAPSFLPAFIPHHLAQSRGYFADNKVEVNFHVGRGGADTAKQVAVSNADLGGGVGETSLIVRSNGLPVRSVALLGGKSLFQVAARRASGITSIKDLRGKKVGVIGYQDTGYYSLLAVLASAGLTRSDLSVEAVGNAGMTQLMIASSLDAIMSTPDWTAIIEAAGVKLTFFPIEPYFKAMEQAVFASDQFIAKRPDTARGFVGALLRAVKDCMDDPASAARDFVAAVPEQAGKAALIETTLKLYVRDVYPTVPAKDLGQFDPARLAKIEDFYLAKQLIAHPVPVQDLYTNAFVS